MTATQVTTATEPATRSWLHRITNRRPAVARLTGSFPALLELAGVLLIICGGVLAHAWNMFNYPRYFGDEGTYMSYAWAILHGELAPYAYGYGHPPLAWMLIAAWTQLTGGFFAFGMAINSGRILMLMIYACAALFVYLIARRLTGSPFAGMFAVTLFSFSPLSIYFQRAVYLDSFAILWVLVALYLQLSSKSRLTYIAGSACAYSIGILSKETAIIFLPIFVYGTWQQVSPVQRRYLLIVFGYVTIALVSTYVLYAELKNELFPTGTLLGGNNPHVSMITTFTQQVGRGSLQGSFLAQWRGWVKRDALLVVGGVVSSAGNLVLSWRRPALRVPALLLLIYLAFLARGGVTFDFYVIPLLPLLALNIAVGTYSIFSLVAEVPRWANRILARRFAPIIVLACMALLLPQELRMNQTNFTASATQPEVAALQWVGRYLPHSAHIVADPYNWVDMRIQGGVATSYGATFDHMDPYWNVATDPAIYDKILHNDWNNIDYIIADSDLIIDTRANQLTLIQAALDHSIPLKTFQNHLYWVTIYEVQHRGSTKTTAPTLIQEVNQSPNPPKGMPGSTPTSAASGG